MKDGNQIVIRTFNNDKLNTELVINDSPEGIFASMNGEPPTQDLTGSKDVPSFLTLVAFGVASLFNSQPEVRVVLEKLKAEGKI